MILILITPSVTPRTNSFLSDFIITEKDIKDTLKSLKNQIVLSYYQKGVA
jgi:hypothetical protein